MKEGSDNTDVQTKEGGRRIPQKRSDRKRSAKGIKGKGEQRRQASDVGGGEMSATCKSARLDKSPDLSKYPRICSLSHFSLTCSGFHYISPPQ
jgi:hypothetical protein